MCRPIYNRALRHCAAYCRYASPCGLDAHIKHVLNSLLLKLGECSKLQGPDGHYMHQANHSIVPLKEKDAACLARLEAECFSTAWDEERYRLLLQATDKALAKGATAGKGLPPFLALGLWESDSSGKEKSGTLVGYITLGMYEAAQEAEVYNIAVAAAHRRKGLGAQLLEQTLAFLTKAGFCRVVLEVRTGNAPALALYSAAGFTRCGLRKGYYADTGEDALVLEAVLGSTEQR